MLLWRVDNVELMTRETQQAPGKLRLSLKEFKSGVSPETTPNDLSAGQDKLPNTGRPSALLRVQQ